MRTLFPICRAGGGYASVIRKHKEKTVGKGTTRQSPLPTGRRLAGLVRCFSLHIPPLLSPHNSRADYLLGLKVFEGGRDKLIGGVRGGIGIVVEVI